jgi:hypothetical protein
MVYGSAEVWSFMSCPASAASRRHRNLREAEPDGRDGAAEHADELPGEQAECDAQREVVGEFVGRQPGEGHAGVGEAEDGEDREGHPPVKDCQRTSTKLPSRTGQVSQSCPSKSI